MFAFLLIENISQSIQNMIREYMQHRAADCCTFLRQYLGMFLPLDVTNYLLLKNLTIYKPPPSFFFCCCWHFSIIFSPPSFSPYAHYGSPCRNTYFVIRIIYRMSNIHRKKGNMIWLWGKKVQQEVFSSRVGNFKYIIITRI